MSTIFEDENCEGNTHAISRIPIPPGLCTCYIALFLGPCTPGRHPPLGPCTPTPQTRHPPWSSPPPGQPPPPSGRTHTCKHITLPQTSFPGGNKQNSNAIYGSGRSRISQRGAPTPKGRHLAKFSPKTACKLKEHRKGGGGGASAKNYNVDPPLYSFISEKKGTFYCISRSCRVNSAGRESGIRG